MNILLFSKVKIIKSTTAESCSYGNIGFDIYFDKPIDKSFAEYLGKLGKYKLDNSFEEPYFKIIVRGYYTLKGSLGVNYLRMIVPESIYQQIYKDFENYINNYQNI